MYQKVAVCANLICFDLAKVRRFLEGSEPVDWQRLKDGLPGQREWLEANEEIEATLHAMVAGEVEASETTLKEINPIFTLAMRM